MNCTNFSRRAILSHNILWLQKQSTVIQRFSVKMVLLEILQKSQENTCPRVSFFCNFYSFFWYKVQSICEEYSLIKSLLNCVSYVPSCLNCMSYVPSCLNCVSYVPSCLNCLYAYVHLSFTCLCVYVPLVFPCLK